MSQDKSSTIVAEGEVVLNMTADELEGNWRSDLDAGEVGTFDAEGLPDDLEEEDRFYFVQDGLLYAQTTVREVGENTVWTTGAMRFKHVADCPIDVPDGGHARIKEDTILAASDRDISSDTVMDLEGWR